MESKRFLYTDQCLNYNDLIIFCAMILLNIGLFLASFMFNAKNGSDPVVDIAIDTLFFIFNIPVIIHFICKAVKMFRFHKKIRYFQTNGKKYRAEIIDERYGKPLFKSETFVIDTYHPIVKFFDSTSQQEITMTSEFPICASYEDALSSNKVTIYVIKDSFIITDFSPAHSEELSLNQRTMEQVKLSKIIKKISNEVQIIYALGAIIVAILMLVVKLLIHWLVYNYM